MIEFQTKNISDRCKEIYDLQKRYLVDDLKLSIILSHFGYFSQDLVNGFSENIEEILISNGDKKQIIKRIFSILIEGLQNIRVHGESDDDGKFYGSFYIAKNENEFKIIFGSLMKTDKKQLIENRLEKLNALHEDDVKEHYMVVLSNGIVSEKGNAGLGFITMRLKSKNLVKPTFFAVSDDLQFFTIELTIAKE
ncbi:MAG: SiaB family protein kinase [Bacteroidota bacterium]